MPDRNLDVYNLGAAPTRDEIKAELRRRLVKMPQRALEQRLAAQVRNPKPPRYDPADRDWNEITRVLDSSMTSGTLLPRVDLEQTVYALVLKQFPYLDRIRKEQANGMVHTWNALTVTGTATDANMTITDNLGAGSSTVTDDTATYKQFGLVNIAVIDTQRGVSLKELAAVRASGMSYSPETLEIMAGTIRLRSAIQRLIFTGNFSDASGTSANESGPYNTNGFDGLRIQLGGGIARYQGLGSGGAGQPNGVVINQDQATQGGPFTLTQAINQATALSGDQGGDPSIVITSNLVKAKIMNENEGKQRTESAELIPGVKVQTIATVNGDLPLMAVPGGANALGSYNRTADSVPVTDMFVLDEQYLTLRWLGSPDISVLEIPSGVDGKLSRRFILLCMYGLQVADMGVFQAKCRVPN